MTEKRLFSRFYSVGPEHRAVSLHRKISLNFRPKAQVQSNDEHEADHCRGLKHALGILFVVAACTGDYFLVSFLWQKWLPYKTLKSPKDLMFLGEKFTKNIFSYCRSCRISASLFGIMLHQFLPLQVTYFRALPHSLEFIFQYIFLSLMILNIMQPDDDCNRVLEVRRGLVVIHCPFSPHQSQGQGNKKHLSCALVEKKKKKKKKRFAGKVSLTLVKQTADFTWFYWHTNQAKKISQNGKSVSVGVKETVFSFFVINNMTKIISKSRSSLLDHNEIC